MRFRSTLPLLLTLCLALFSAPALAAVFTVGSSSGGEPHPDANSEVQEGFNPTITCGAENGGTIYEVLLCLLDEIISIPAPPCFDLIIASQQPDSGLGGQNSDVLSDVMQANGDDPCPVNPEDRSDFIVRMLPVMPPYGLEIVTLQEEEIEKITLWENDSSIQWTTLTLNKPNRRIRIGDIDPEERPSGRGAIYLTLNDREMKIPTAKYNSPIELTAAIYRTLADNGFALKRETGVTWVTYDNRSRRHIEHVSFRSTDPAVVTSDIGILPPLPNEIGPATYPLLGDRK